MFQALEDSTTNKAILFKQKKYQYTPSILKILSKKSVFVYIAF